MSIGELDTDRLAAFDAELRRQEFAAASRDGRNKANQLEEMWRRSEECHRENLRRTNAALWYEFHMRLCESHASISAEHEAKALALLEGGGAVA